MDGQAGSDPASSNEQASSEPFEIYVVDRVVTSDAAFASSVGMVSIFLQENDVG